MKLGNEKIDHNNFGICDQHTRRYGKTIHSFLSNEKASASGDIISVNKLFMVRVLSVPLVIILAFEANYN